MITARKNAVFNFAMRRLLSWTLRRRFHNIYIAGESHLRELASGRAVVGCVNHTNWWDGFVLYVLSHRLLPHDIYLAMEEKNLRRYPFFAWMGVFGLDLCGTRRALRGLRYAIRLLNDKSNRSGRPPLVWMFVQGRLSPSGTPIEVKEGALLLAKHSGAAILPMVLRYEWLIESRPSIFVNIGSPLPSTVTAEELADSLNRLFGSVPTAMDSPAFAEYQPLYSGRMSMNKRWDYLMRGLRRTSGAFDKQNR